MQSQIEAAKELIATFKLKELELNIHSLENNIAKLKSQINMVKNEKELTSITHEIEHSQKKLADLENQYFELTEQSENLLQNIQDNQNFINGSKATLAEIEKDVTTIIEENQKEISNYQKRIEALLEIEKPGNRKIYLETAKKFQTTSPCSFIAHKNCSACRINIDSVTVANVEHARSLEFCPSCGRILLPKDLNL
jgi:predicted  nucleic acid-binding Zn-ribbon protein